MKGFSKIEIIIIIVFVLLTVFLAVRSYSASIHTSRDLQRKFDIRLIKNMLIGEYVRTHKVYPQGQGVDVGMDKNGCNDVVEFALQCPLEGKPILKDVPSDPNLTIGSGYSYFGYDEGRRFFLFATLENPLDEDSTLVGGFPPDWPFAQNIPYFLLTEKD